MANPLPGVVVTYERVSELTDLSLNVVHQAGRLVHRSHKPHDGRKRQPLDIHSLESVCLWLAGHGRTELRRKMCAYAAPALLGPGETKPPQRKRS